jgi:hypothetical protein
MNPAYLRIIAARDEDRRGLFLAAANRIGTTVQNIEKDFWVCWTLDALFHRLQAGGPRLLFKGGTSLSKAYGLISRFSEDIDVTVFRQDIGEAATFEELETLGSRQRNKRLDAIKQACQIYINGPLRTELEDLAKDTMQAAGRKTADLRVSLDEHEPDRQSLLIVYPSAVEPSDYVTASVKIESGAKSALDPHALRAVTPYLSDDLPDGDALTVPGVVTIDPERTLLDKILILHGMPFWFEARSELRGNGRMSRHYYDVHRMLGAPIGAKALVDDALISDCVRHARMFFHRNNTGLELAQRGTFRLRPTAAMLDPLRQDYARMATMIFGDVPSFDAVMESVATAEAKLNAV